MSHQSNLISKNDAEDVLEHFGVKGMRWGVRRSRAERAVAKLQATPKPTNKNTKNLSVTGKTVREIKKNRKEVLSKRRELDDDQLRAFTSRLEAEKKLKTLITEDVSPAKAHIQKALIEVGTDTAKTAVKKYATSKIDKAIVEAGLVSKKDVKKSNKTKSEPKKTTSKKKKIRFPKKVTTGPVVNQKK